MTDKVKRMNYYDHQFLRQADFLAEQNYHLSMRRLHNSELHTPGILDGLDVTPVVGGSATAVAVKSGMAIDSAGREIVLPENTNLELGGMAVGTTVYITIAYHEDLSDSSADAGGPGFTRVTELPTLASSTAAPVDPNTLILARVPRTQNGLGTIDVSDRKQAGAKLGRLISLTANSLILSNGSVPAANWPALSCSAANQATFANAGLLVNGNVGIGTTTPGVKLEVNGALKFTNAGADANDGRIGSALFATGLNLVGIKTDATYRKVSIWGEITQQQNDGTNTWTGTNFFKGNVGIGTTTPVSDLHIRKDVPGKLGPILTVMNGGGGGGSTAAIDLSGYDPKGEAAPLRIQAIDDGKFSADLAFYAKAPGDIKNKLVETMRLTSAGNVGIGMTSPGYKFDVDGTLHATGAVRFDSTFSYGDNSARTEPRDNAGLQGNAGAQSGFFQTDKPTNYPSGATSWWHLLDVRHTNPANNYALQIAGSFYDQDAYFRKTNNSASTAWNKFIYANSAGNVGIGTTAPVSDLHIRKDVPGKLGPILTVMNGGGGGGSTAAIDLSGYDPKGEATPLRIQAIDDGKFSADLAFYAKEPGDIKNKLLETMRLTSAGNLGIGTPSPSRLLQLTKSASGALGPELVLQNSASFATGNAVQIAFQTDGTTGAGRYNAAIKAVQDGLGSAGFTALTFGTFGSGGGTPDERMRITSTGNVGIGTPTPGAKLDVRGQVQMPSLSFQDAAGVGYKDNWLGMADNVDVGKNKWLHIGGITDNTDGKGAKRRIALFADPIFLGGSVGIGTATPAKPLDVAGSGGIRISQTASADQTNEILFQDNGQIRSTDDNHRIIFDRANNILELREYGDLVFSPGASAGKRTDRLRITSAGKMVSSMWQVTEVMKQVQGALPKNNTFNSGGGTLMMICSGSGYASGTGGNIGMTIQLDGKDVGNTHCYTNEPSSHKTFTTHVAVVPNVAAGKHTVNLVALTGTNTDANDYFDVTVLELPF